MVCTESLNIKSLISIFKNIIMVTIRNLLELGKTWGNTMRLNNLLPLLRWTHILDT